MIFTSIFNFKDVVRGLELFKVMINDSNCIYYGYTEIELNNILVNAQTFTTANNIIYVDGVDIYNGNTTPTYVLTTFTEFMNKYLPPDIPEEV